MFQALLLVSFERPGRIALIQVEESGENCCNKSSHVSNALDLSVKVARTTEILFSWRCGATASMPSKSKLNWFASRSCDWIVPPIISSPLIFCWSWDQYVTIAFFLASVISLHL